MRINHYRVPCIGEAVQLCYVVKIGDQAAWEFFYDAIDGFTSYQWGHTYELAVVRQEVEHPPQDASSVRYILARIVSDEAVPADTEFSFTLRGDELRPYVTGSPEAGFQLLGELAIRCETEEVCSAFSRALETGQTVRATFRHAGDGGAVLLLSLIEV